jgi:hypothetical protein
MSVLSLKERAPNTIEREVKRGTAPLSYSSPSPLGKGIKGMGPSLSDRGGR